MGKIFGWDCNYKDDKDFCTTLLKPKICRPSICFYGLSETNEHEE